MFQKIKSVLGLGLQLAKANFKLKNEGSLLGIFWYLLEPFLFFVVLMGLRGFLSGGGMGDYPLYLLLGLVIYNFFSKVTISATRIVVGRSNFIKSIKINHESLIVSQVLEGLYSHFFEILLFIGFMVYFGSSLIWILTYPLILVFLVLFILGLSFILASLGVFFVDLNNVWRVLMRLLFFATPIFYIAEKGSLVYKLNLFNPLFYFLNISRDLIIYNRIPVLGDIIIMVSMSLVMFVVGLMMFEEYKSKFAEMV